MWHEARRQEKKIRGLMVDFRRRAERRREYYEKFKLDPTQFLRIYGRPVKVHLENSVALAAESPNSMMPWQGNRDIMIDRFDVRAHLDYIPEVKIKEEKLSHDEQKEESKTNYESYRVLVQNECTGVSETQCLHQIDIDEQFGATPEMIKRAEEEKKRLSEKKAAIAYIYEDSTPGADGDAGKSKDTEDDEEEDEEDSDEEVDLDMAFDVEALTDEQIEMLNTCAVQFGMSKKEYVKSLRKDKEELEAIRLAKLLEEEKAQFAGRKSRRERRAYKEKRLKDRQLSPPSYAARDSPKYEPYKRGSSSEKSRSPSPVNSGQVHFITSFGGDSDEEKGVMQGPNLPPHLQPKSTANQMNRSRFRSPSPKLEVGQSDGKGKHRSRSRSRSRDRRRDSGNSRKDRSSSRSRSRSRSRYARRGSRDRRSRSRDRRSRDRKSRSRDRRSRSRDRRSRSRDRRRRSRSVSHSRRGHRRSRSYSRSRSSSYSNSSRSRSRSRKRSYSKSRSRSKSPSNNAPPPIKRYRRPSTPSEKSSEDSESEVKAYRERYKSSGGASSQKAMGKTAASLNTPNSTRNSRQELLKKKMQLALNRQYKADRRARQEKMSKQEQTRMDREDELRNMAIQMRRREREKRHKETTGKSWSQDGSEDVSSSSSKSRSRSRSKEREKKRKPRSRSKTPERQEKRSYVRRSPSPTRGRRGLVNY